MPRKPRNNRPELTTRSESLDEQTRDCLSRSMTIRAATVDEKNRSVEAVLTTENPVTVMDWERWEPIDEVLLSDGCEAGRSVPMLECHMRSSLDNVLGSVRDIRKETGQVSCRLYFADDDPSERAWKKVSAGHINDVSAGYRAVDFVDIQPGQTANVDGRSYTASANRRMRITRRWQLREGSLVPIGADRAAKIREDMARQLSQRGEGGSSQKPPANTGQENRSMNEQVRKYLESLGLRKDATDDQAKAFLAALGGEQKTRADSIEQGKMTLEQALAGGQRTEPAPVPKEPAPAQQQVDPDRVRQEATTAERTRIATIRQMAGADVSSELVERAITDGLTPEQAGVRFLADVRGQRTPAVGGDAPNVITGRSHEQDCTAQVLGLAIAMRSGIDVKRYAERNHIQNWDQVAERADAYSDMSMVDYCRECLRLSGKRIPHSRAEMIREAVSSGSITNAFTTSINARVLQGWDEAGDSTSGWVEEEDVANYTTQDEITYAAQARMKRRPRGKAAEHATMSDAAEHWKLAAFARQLRVDEQDIIDDRFGILQRTPFEFGQAARRLRPDLVYSLMQSNPTMTTDNKAVFEATYHKNYATSGSALAAASVQAGVVAMMKQTLNSGKDVINLNIMPKYLIVPPSLKFDAEILLRSTQRIIAVGSGGTYNPLAEAQLDLRVDNRLSSTGVINPLTDTVQAGSESAWYLAAVPGRTIKVGYLRGTSRLPRIRPFILDKGEFGIGWDIHFDIGGCIVDWRGLYKATGAA